MTCLRTRKPHFGKRPARQIVKINQQQVPVITIFRIFQKPTSKFKPKFGLCLPLRRQLVSYETESGHPSDEGAARTSSYSCCLLWWMAVVLVPGAWCRCCWCDTTSSELVAAAGCLPCLLLLVGCCSWFFDIIITNNLLPCSCHPAQSVVAK